MSKVPTVQIRPSVTVDTEILLRLMSEKRQEHIGKIIERLLQESKTFKEAEKKFKDFSDEF